MDGLDRRRAVLGGAAFAAAAVSNSAAARAATASLAGAPLYADVKAYSALGEHRTGTAGDAATTRWLARALKAAGYQVEIQAFDCPVFDLDRADIVLGGRILESFPYWTPRATPAGGVTGPLAVGGKPGGVALVVLPPGAGGGLYQPPPAEVVAASESGAGAVVVVTETPLGELAALNRTPQAPAWKVPVVLAAGRDKAALLAAAVAATPVTVRLDGRMAQGRGENVIGRRPARSKPVVISTPKSGWFHCAGERGSGVAIWLGLARWLATTEMNIVLLAASGHEFDGYGGQRFAQTLAPKPADTALWVHIGANVAAYDFARGPKGEAVRQSGPQGQRMLAVSEPLIAAAARAFAGQPGYAQPFDIDQRKAPGEVAHFQALGYAPLIGVVAGHPLHHTRRDLPDVTGPDMLEPVARRLASLIAEVA